LPNGGSETALFYDNLRIAGVQYTGTYGAAEVAQMIYLGFTFETIVTPEDRATVMGAVLRYFGLITGMADDHPAAPLKFELGQNYPNPFNPATTIFYSLPATSQNTIVRLEIFNALGQKIRTLVSEKQNPGKYAVEWDGKNDFGLPVSSGTYFYRLTAGDFRAARKMALIR
jgi:hypothetical protein